MGPFLPPTPVLCRAEHDYSNDHDGGNTIHPFPSPLVVYVFAPVTAPSAKKSAKISLFFLLISSWVLVYVKLNFCRNQISRKWCDSCNQSNNGGSRK
jgi:hypothetical protein